MKKTNWFLIFVLVIATLLRLPYLNNHMSSLYGDEIAIGYNALSIVKTGRDEFGKFMPLQFQSWGDQKNPVYIYAVALVQLITGPTSASVRIPSALAGILAIYLTYRLMILLKLSEGSAIMAALLLAMTPWHIHISRGGYEANLALTLGLASVYCLLKKKNLWSVFYLVLACYTYYTTKMFAPMLLGFVWIWSIWGQKISTWIKPFIIYWFTVFILAMPIIYLALFANGQARFFAINIFNNPLTENQVIRGRNFFENPNSLTAKVLENRYVYHFLDFTTYYFDNFSGQFLLVGGDSNVRYGLANHGMLYMLDAPLILFGIMLMYKKNKRVTLLFLAWILLAPLPTALVGKAYGLRSLAMLPIPQIFAGFALYEFIVWSKISRMRSLLFTVFSMLYLLSFGNWIMRYIYQYPTYGSYWYDSVMLEAIDYAKAREDNYDNIIITQSYGETSMYFAYYNHIDPRIYREAKSNKLIIDGVPMIKLGKYYFGDIRPKGPLSQMDIPSNTLLIVEPLFEYVEDSINARDDGRTLYRVFSFPTKEMKAKEGRSK